MPRVNDSTILKLLWQNQLSDYVTAIGWFPVIAAHMPANSLVASSAAGEVVCFTPTASGLETSELQAATGQSIDCLAISQDGQFVAAGGQSGTVSIWQWQDQDQPKLIAELDNAPAWVDRLAWNPLQNQLAFSLGRYVQVWDADVNEVVTTLNFENSSVLDITWHPNGDRLTVSGYKGIKVWSAKDWDDDPYLVDIPSASNIIAWSPNGQYIASGNIDRTIAVLEWENPHLPWVMRGFPGKIRQLVWSKTQKGAPLLASSSAQSIVIWKKHPDSQIGWEGTVIGEHDDRIQAMQFQPDTSLLASAGAEGWVALWQKNRMVQMLKGASKGFSSLAWQPQGQQLAAGGEEGELMVWSRVMRGKGFG